MDRIDQQGALAIFDALGGIESPVQRPVPALLGDPESYAIEVPLEDAGIPGLVYLHGYGPSYALNNSEDADRADDQQGKFTALLPAHLNIPLVYDTPVLTARQGGRLVVVGTMPREAREFLYGVPQQVSAPAVERYQLQYQLLRPTDTPSMSVVLSGAVVRVGDTLTLVSDRVTLDLSSHLAGLTAGQARALLLAIDTSDMSIVVHAGDPFTDNRDPVSGVSDHGALFAHYPVTLASETERAWGWAKLYHGMSAIGVNDLLPMLDTGDGGGGGSGSDTFAGLSDTTIADPQIGHVPYWTGSTWANRYDWEGAKYLGVVDAPQIVFQGLQSAVLLDGVAYQSDGVAYDSDTGELTLTPGVWELTGWLQVRPRDPVGGGRVRAVIFGSFAGETNPGEKGSLSYETPAGLDTSDILHVQVHARGYVDTNSAFTLEFDNQTPDADFDILDAWLAVNRARA